MTLYNVKVYFKDEEGFVQLVNMTKDLVMSYINEMLDCISSMYITQFVDSKANKRWKYDSEYGSFVRI